VGDADASVRRAFRVLSHHLKPRSYESEGLMKRQQRRRFFRPRAEVLLPFIERLVWQFTVRKWAGPLYKRYAQVLDDWRSITRLIVWTNAKARGGRLVRKSLQAKNFGGYWNHVVRCKSLTARARVLRDFYPRRDTGREFTDLPGPAGDDPALEAERNERRLRLAEVSRNLPTNLDRLIFHHLIDGTFDLRMVAASARCSTQTVRRAFVRVRARIQSILDHE
jgi:hypothetical protein